MGWFGVLIFFNAGTGPRRGRRVERGRDARFLLKTKLTTGSHLSVRRGKGEGAAAVPSWAEGVTPAHAGKRRREGRRWAAPAGQKGRGGGNEPEMVFLIYEMLFFFLFPEFHTQVPERNFKS